VKNILESSDSDLEQFFLDFQHGFLKAAESGGVQQRRLVVARRSVTISFAGNALLGLARPLAHLEDQNGEAAAGLRILIWEGSVGWSPPKPIWKQGQQGFQGEILGLGSGRFQVNYHDTSGLFHMIDYQSQVALYWIPRAVSLPPWEIASPFRIIFHWWARSLGGHVAHAAAVGKDGQGVLLVGKSGSGKSTASLACLRYGMEFVGDDYVILLCEPTLHAHSIYNSAKIHTKFLLRILPEWQDMVAAEIQPRSKSVFFLQERFPEAIRRTLKVQAVILPQVASAPGARLTRCPSSVGWLALVPSTIFQLPDARREATAFFAGLMRDMPMYAMRTGPDHLTSVPEALLGLLDRDKHHLQTVGDE
jgi:hypothetical protein